jgi:hypothetical protein
MLLALIYMQLDSEVTNWTPPHKALQDSRSWEYLKEFWSEGGNKLNEWELLNCGLFEEDPAVLLRLLEGYVSFAKEDGSNRLFGDFPDFAAVYSQNFLRLGQSNS